MATLPGRLRRWTSGLAGLLILAWLATLLPPVQDRVRAAATLAQALGLPVPFAPEVTRGRALVGGVDGDLYLPAETRSTLVLVPGAAPAGRDDPRVVRLARGIASIGSAVFVPELDLYQEQIVPDDIERIVRAVEALAMPREGASQGVPPPQSAGAGRGGDRVALVGISFGGSLALVAAADPRLEGRLSQVAVFGAYFDLLGIVQAGSTGVSLPGDTPIPWDPDPRAPQLIRDGLLALLAPRQREAVLRRLDHDAAGGDRPGQAAARVDGRTAAPSGYAADPGTDLPDEEARAVYELLSNRDPSRTFPLAARLSEPLRRRLAAVSPASVADRIRVPVLAMHSTDDPAVPYGELLRLQQGLPQARLVTVQSFRHVDLLAGNPAHWPSAARDLVRVLGFVRDALPELSDLQVHGARE